MKKNIETLLTLICFLFILALFFIFPKTIIESVTFSFSIWLDNLLPTIFPFLILGYFITNYGISNFFSEILKPLVQNLFHLSSSSGFIITLSILSGFPSNAKFIKDTLDNNEITIVDANHLLKFCFYPNPLFVIGTVGTIFLGNTSLGIIILISHILSSFIIAFIFRPRQKIETEAISFSNMFYEIKKKRKSSITFASVLKQACLTSLDTMFLLLGIITVFLILTNLTSHFLSLPPIFDSLFRGSLEMTQGLKIISFLDNTLFIKTILSSIILSFGGICIHTQIFSILENNSFSYSKFLLFRMIHVIFSVIFTTILFFVFFI